MKLRLISIICSLVPLLNATAYTILDTPDGDIKGLFLKAKTKYVIRYSHTFTDTLKVPEGCELDFNGGSLSGPIVFHYTKLSGDVNLKGSSLNGTIKNKTFIASWLCYIDGKTDDAKNINELIKLCDRIYFPVGRYMLKSEYVPKEMVPSGYESSITSHIGINKSHVWLIGEQGATFVTDQPLCTICVFSQPNQIKHSIMDINIKGITFEVHNDGKNFHEFMCSIVTIGVNGMKIENCTFSDFWGDAICLSHYGDEPTTGERTRNQNIKILNNTIVGGKHHNNRNGISIINGKNILVRDNVIKNTSRYDMPGGIDVEPNNSAYTIENIKIEDNIFEGVGGTVGAVGIVLLRDQAPAYNVSVIRNTIRNCSCGISLCIKTDMSSGGIEIKDNFIAGDTRPYNFVGSGSSKDWVISGNVFEQPCLQNMPGHIKIENLVIKNNKKKE